MAELKTMKNSDMLWLLDKERNKYPLLSDLHIHVHSEGMTVTLTAKKDSKKYHKFLPPDTTDSGFGELLHAFYQKLVQEGNL